MRHSVSFESDSLDEEFMEYFTQIPIQVYMDSKIVPSPIRDILNSWRQDKMARPFEEEFKKAICKISIIDVLEAHSIDNSEFRGKLLENPAEKKSTTDINALAKEYGMEISLRVLKEINAAMGSREYSLSESKKPRWDEYRSEARKELEKARREGCDVAAVNIDDIVGQLITLPGQWTYYVPQVVKTALGAYVKTPPSKLTPLELQAEIVGIGNTPYSSLAEGERLTIMGRHGRYSVNLSKLMAGPPQMGRRHFSTSIRATAKYTGGPVRLRLIGAGARLLAAGGILTR